MAMRASVTSLVRQLVTKLREAIRTGHALGYTLSTLEGIVDTSYSNILTPDEIATIGRIHQSVLAERFDPRDLPAYNQFLREQALLFLIQQYRWLKGRESKSRKKRKRTVYVGCGLFGFRSF